MKYDLLYMHDILFILFETKNKCKRFIFWTNFAYITHSI
jgi:hypothetical protein